MLFTREQLEEKEIKTLAAYSCFSRSSKGRKFQENKDPYRTCFQRDRDRIIHSKAFRRLKGKTQVFVSHYGDHYRSRLTHTMEVAQISRDMARTFGLNEDLAESIALAHDLGHTPFGHAGEEALDKEMKVFGSSFEHNRQSLHIVTQLELRSYDFSGLNLSQEILDGLGKHDTPYDRQAEPGALPSLEAQIVNIADEIAYMNHDIDDGIRSGILHMQDMQKIKLWKDITILFEEKNFDIWMKKCVSQLIHRMIHNVYQESLERIKKENIQSQKDVQECTKKLIAFSSSFYKEKEALRAFLFQNLYREKKVVEMNQQGQKIISELFQFFTHNPQKIPDEYSQKSQGKELHFIVKDYISGMTDQFAKTSYESFCL